MTDKPKRKQPLRGATEARVHSPLLKGKSRANEIFEMVDRLNMEKLMPYQKWVLQDMMSVDKKGAYRRKTLLLLISRQNGKSFLGRVRVIWGMFYGDEKKLIIMSANRATSLMLFREIAWTIESTPELKAMTKAIRYANGGERIELLNGATLDVISDNSSSSPRGRTADFLWVDEVREISEDGFKAAVPVTRARANAQTFLTSNAGDHFSTVLNGLVERAKDYPPETFGYYEYSAPQYCKIDLSTDTFWRTAVAPSNPALGYTITKESIEEAIATNPIEQTRTETLCQWIDSLQSPWPHGVLEETSDNTLEIAPGAYTVFGFDVSPSRRNACLVAGQLLPDGRIGIGILETFSSQMAIDELKMAASIKAWCDIYHPRLVCYDKYATQTIADRLSQAGVMCEDVSGQQFYKACGDFLEGLVNHRVVHNGMAEFIQQMNNCAAKVNDSAWRIIKRKSAGDISAPIGLAMVVSKLMLPAPKPQIYS
jgi:phage terminase large subunit-like protein